MVVVCSYLHFVLCTSTCFWTQKITRIMGLFRGSLKVPMCSSVVQKVLLHDCCRPEKKHFCIIRGKEKRWPSPAFLAFAYLFSFKKRAFGSCCCCVYFNSQTKRADLPNEKVANADRKQ